MLHEKHKNLTWRDIKELITYQPPTGKAYWNYRDVRWFKSQHDCNAWNSRFAGKEIQNTDNQGYIRPTLLGVFVGLHRLIWFYQTGEWPEEDVDHINGNKVDNRWENLRSVTTQENCRNRRRPKNNTSGHMGVHWDKICHRWQARISIGDKRINLGYFISYEEAVAARKAAEIEYGYHELHGRD